ncbi:uncharacterized protein LOC131072585 [Cryptomeria japonica]|uniref:uncharacterized protein LOC131072585 n=1 Tax=Cryptomeria japonica TaxID=3369 RepID=UPI0025ACBE1C|nr:uncharacterized protein LOC131072585 [Cryptomeria japonica]XP_057864766.1 uncharacterized protein LOC131072585 [Cryptomeria japonica]
MDFMIPSSDNTGAMRGSKNNRYPSLANMIRFEHGKRKKELLPSEADEHIVRNGDEGKIADNLTPTRRKKTKLLKSCPAQSLHSKSNFNIYNTNTWILESNDGFQLKSSEKLKSENTIHAGGSLDLLYDAIQVVEYQILQKSVGIQAQEKDLMSVLSENVLRQGKNAMGIPSLQSNPYWANASVEMDAAKELAREGQPSDVRYNPKCILKAVGIDVSEGAIPLTRSKERRLPKLPVKYSDSVLQPWKKVTRKKPKY